MADKSPEELAAEKLATDEAARVAAEAETARLAAEEAEKQKNAGKTTEQLAAEEAEAKRVVDAKAAEEARAKGEGWEAKRVAKLAADKAALVARLQQYETPDGKPKAAPAVDDKGDLLPKAEIERLANERAQQLAGQQAFNAACNAVAQEGRKVFPDFDASVKELGKLVDRTDQASVQAYDSFLEAALETGEAPKIIYALGRDLEEASRIMELSPIKRAQELAVLASASAEQVSGLPKPITTVQGKNAGPSEISPDDAGKSDKLSSAEWHKRRQAQVDASKPSYERRQVGR